jgi:hypothetical protein
MAGDSGKWSGTRTITRAGLVAAASRSRKRTGRGRDWLGDRSHRRDSLGARGDEHFVRDPTRACGRVEGTEGRAERWAEFIKRLARVSDVTFAKGPPEGAIQLVVRGETAALPLKGVIDLAAERARLEKEMAKVAADIKRADAKLSNADFLKRAPEEVVDGEREKREEAAARQAKIVEALERLNSAR